MDSGGTAAGAGESVGRSAWAAGVGTGLAPDAAGAGGGADPAAISQSDAGADDPTHAAVESDGDQSIWGDARAAGIPV